MKKYLLIGIIFGVLTLVGAGCTLRFGSGDGDIDPSKDGGIFEAVLNSKGDIDWTQKVKTLTPAGKKTVSLENENVTALVADPSDGKIVYVALAGNGLWQTGDGGANWQQTKSDNLPANVVKKLIVDAQFPCNLYVVFENSVWQSDTCGRAWSEIFTETRSNVVITAIAADFFDSKNLYLGTDEGDFFRSVDRGKTWFAPVRFENRIVSIVPHPQNKGTVMVLTSKGGIQRTTDFAVSWSKLVMPGTELFEGSNTPYGLYASPAEKDSYIYVSKYGLMKTLDGGVTWAGIRLLTPENTVRLRLFGIHPQKPQIIFYATNNAFYTSVDSGKTWLPKALPTRRLPVALVVPLKNPDSWLIGVASQ